MIKEPVLHVQHQTMQNVLNFAFEVLPIYIYMYICIYKIICYSNFLEPTCKSPNFVKHTSTRLLHISQAYSMM